MALTQREKNRQALLRILEDNNLTTAAAAKLLSSSAERVASWRRETGATPTPMWAIELLQFKVDALKVAAAKQRGSKA